MSDNSAHFNSPNSFLNSIIFACNISKAVDTHYMLLTITINAMIQYYITKFTDKSKTQSYLCHASRSEYQVHALLCLKKRTVANSGKKNLFFFNATMLPLSECFWPWRSWEPLFGRAFVFIVHFVICFV